MNKKAKLAAFIMASLIGASVSDKVYANEVVDKEIINQDYELSKTSVVKAILDTNIYDSVECKKVIGTLSEGKTLPYNCLWDEGFYEVRYEDGIGFLKCNDCDLTYKYNIENMVTFTNDTLLYQDDINTGKVNKIEIEKQNVGKLLKTVGTWSMVEVDNEIGFVKTSDTDILDDTFVLIDLSDQELKLYHENEIVLDCPIISGKDKTPSHTGDFNVYQKRYDTVLVGKNNSYRSPVDVFMPYFEGEGLHDAYRWRNDSEYDIEDYYKNHGSHGCINMKKDDALFAAEYVEVGTRVLVKK